MSDDDADVGTAQPDNQALLRDLNAATTPTAATPTPPAQGVPPWESKPSVPGPTAPVRSRESVTPDAVGTPGVPAAVTPEPPPTSGLIPGTGSYAGLTWDGANWSGTATVPQQQNGKGTASLVIGIIAILLCGGGFILPLLSITFGWTGMKRAKAGLASNGGVAKAGFILGLVAAGMGLIVGAMYLVALASNGGRGGY